MSENIRKYVRVGHSNKIQDWVVESVEEALKNADWETLSDLDDLYENVRQAAEGWSDCIYYHEIAEIVGEWPGILGIESEEYYNNANDLLQDIITEETVTESEQAMSIIIGELNDIYCEFCEDTVMGDYVDPAEVLDYKGKGTFTVVCPECERAFEYEL